jgi:putative Holliday junction resolvase
MGRVLAVDWGTRRVGIAVSDESRTLARPLPILEVDSRDQVLRDLAALAAECGAEEVLVGHPLNLDGTAGESAREAQRLAEALRAALPEVRVVLVDERLTSVQAEAILRERGEKLRGRKQRVDQVSASILLQEYLDAEEKP